MKRVIYKYPVIDGKANLPKLREIVHVGYQNSDFGKGLMVWAIVDPSYTKEWETIFILMTGEDVPNNTRHIRSFEMDGGIMAHAFEWYFGEG